jgi:acyl-CoA synthetase (NDP forming)
MDGIVIVSKGTRTVPMAAALGYKQSLSLLEAYGIETPVQVLVRTAEQFDYAIADRMRYPLVVKAIPADAGHKTEKQLVMTGLHTAKEAKSAFNTLSERSRGVQLECFAIQEQAKGIEFIVGSKRDDVFGQTLMFGMGGVYVELTADFSVRVCPLDFSHARQMLLETKAAAFFSRDGFRGIRANLEATAGLLVNASRMIEENPQICEMDLNPVIATADACYAVDARIITEARKG